MVDGGGNKPTTQESRGGLFLFVDMSTSHSRIFSNLLFGADVGRPIAKHTQSGDIQGLAFVRQKKTVRLSCVTRVRQQRAPGLLRACPKGIEKIKIGTTKSLHGAKHEETFFS